MYIFAKCEFVKDDIQIIFKLICRVTKLKTNLKGKYDTYECSLFGGEEETQANILQCPKIAKMNEDKYQNMNIARK